jgi:hypothetical protein
MYDIDLEEFARKNEELELLESDFELSHCQPEPVEFDNSNPYRWLKWRYYVATQTFQMVTCDELELATWFRAMRYYDIFWSRTVDSCSERFVGVVAAACVLVACKFDVDVDVIWIDQVLRVLAVNPEFRNIESSEVIETEIMVLQVLDWNLGFPTMLDRLSVMLCRDDMSCKYYETRFISIYLASLVTCFPGVLNIHDSHMASACLAVARSYWTGTQFVPPGVQPSERWKALCRSVVSLWSAESATTNLKSTVYEGFATRRWRRVSIFRPVPALCLMYA